MMRLSWYTSFVKPYRAQSLGLPVNFERRLAGTFGTPYPATCRLSSCLLLPLALSGAALALVVDELLSEDREALLASAAGLPNLCWDVHLDLCKCCAVALVVA